MEEDKNIIMQEQHTQQDCPKKNAEYDDGRLADYYSNKRDDNRSISFNRDKNQFSFDDFL